MIMQLDSASDRRWKVLSGLPSLGTVHLSGFQVFQKRVISRGSFFSSPVLSQEADTVLSAELGAPDTSQGGRVVTMAVNISGLRRNIKNVAHNYTDAQVGR